MNISYRKLLYPPKRKLIPFIITAIASLIILIFIVVAVTRYSSTSPPSTSLVKQAIPVYNYMFKVNNRNTRTRCEICSKLTIKIPEDTYSSVSFVNFEQVNAGWDSVKMIDLLFSSNIDQSLISLFTIA